MGGRLQGLYSNSRFVAAISKSRILYPVLSSRTVLTALYLAVQDSALCYVKHPARLRNRGYNLAFSHNGNCWIVMYLISFVKREWRVEN